MRNAGLKCEISTQERIIEIVKHELSCEAKNGD